MPEVSTNIPIAPLFSADELIHNCPKWLWQDTRTRPTPRMNNAHIDSSLSEPLEIYDSIIQPEGNIGIRPISQLKSPIANIESYSFDEDIITCELSKQFHAITQYEPTIPRQESYKVSLPILPVATSFAESSLEPFERCVPRRLAILDEIDTLERWSEDYADNIAPKPDRPSDELIAKAKQVVGELLDMVISKDMRLDMPFICYDDDGYISLVWSVGDHELYLEIREDRIRYVKVWGINIHSEMEMGVPSRDNYLSLWAWLLND